MTKSCLQFTGHVFAPYQVIGVCLSVLLAAYAIVTPSYAQTVEDRKAPQIDIVRLPSGEGEAPIIDGDLSDAAWSRAAVIDQFTQINPVQGGRPSERTHVSLLYTDTHLYIGAKMFDQNPEQITAKVMTRDTNVEKDDHIEIFLDSFDTGRDSYFFTVSPTGARRDGLTENNSKYTEQWDAIWIAKTKVTDAGWQAEIAIPFQSFSYDASLPSIGLQIRRHIPRKNEDIAWALTDQSLPTYDLTDRGRLTGIKDTKSGIGLEIEGLITASANYHWDSAQTDEWLEPSANIHYQITPSLTGTVSLNTDFSDTPLDPRLVNTDRFSLFFPETRDFFLQDQNLFAFGGRPLRAVNGLPFFSRRIGLINQEGAVVPVDIDAGVKLSGSAGAFNIAALTTRTQDSDALEGQTLSVARVSADLGHDSRLGMIVTDGDPLGLMNNRVFGIDGQYKNTTLFAGRQIAADAFYLRSQADGDTQDGDSYGLELAYPNDGLNYYVRFKHIDETYAPALGFVNRAGVRDYNGQLRLRRRYDASDIRYDSLGFISSTITDLQGDVQSGENGAYLQRVWQDGSSILGFALFDREVVETPFVLSDGKNGITIPVGDYRWTRGDFVYDTGDTRDWGFSAEVDCCDWYDGEKFTFVGSVHYRPSKYFNLSGDYSLNKISVSGGDVDIHVLSLDGIVNITPDMQISNQLQYDNLSENMGYFGRFRWALRPETELLITASHGAQVDFNYFRASQTGLSIRLGNSYRF